MKADMGVNMDLPHAAPHASGHESGHESGAGSEAFCFAHLSDPHLTSLRGVRCPDLLNKRLLGYLSWRWRRRREHRGEVLEALLADLDRHRPRLRLVTGDLTHVGLPREFMEAAAWLRRLGAPDEVLVIPGNHDSYVRAPWDRTYAHWRPYLDEVADGNGFPLLRRQDGVAFIGASSACPTPPFFATGRLGRAQLARLEGLLAETGRAGLVRVLLIHHPPLPGAIAWRKRLVDARALTALLRRTGVELILHGHTHRATCGELVTAAGPAPVLGVPSASALGHKPGRRARYHLCRITAHGAARRLEVFVRGYDPVRRQFVALERRELALPGSFSAPAAAAAGQ